MHHAIESGIWPRHATAAVFTVLLLGSLGGCGNGTVDAQNADKQATTTPTIAASDSASSNDAAPSDAPAHKTDWSLVPLTQADVQLCLSVMRAAAERVRHPTAEDIAAPGLVKRAGLELKQGHGDQLTEAEDKAIDLAGTLQGHADDLIVEERHIDAEKYSRIVDRVEDAVIPPTFDIQADGDPSDAVEATKNANIKLLAPYRDEIRALQTAVRDMTPRP